MYRSQSALLTVGAAVVPPATNLGTPSFEQFFDTEHDDLLRYCWGLTQNRETAREIAQEAMTRAWRDWDRIAEGNPVGWLRTVSLNLVRQRWRDDQRDVRLTDRLRSRRFAVVAEPSVDTSIADALQALAPKQREAIVLHHMCDLPVAEVATIMGVSAASVKTHLQRGRAALVVPLSAQLDSSPNAIATETDS